MKKLLIIPAVFVSLLSCGNPYVIQPLQDQSATAQVPCEPDMIEVIEHKINADGSAEWTALCQGYTYDCNRESGDQGAVSCVKMDAQMPE